MIARAFAAILAAAAAITAMAFAALWYSAVPRPGCDWAQDFCSDYGAFYLGLAVISAIVAALASAIFIRTRRK